MVHEPVSQNGQLDLRGEVEEGRAPRGKHGRESLPAGTSEHHPKAVRPPVQAGAEGSDQGFVFGAAGQFLDLVQQEDGRAAPAGNPFEQAIQVKQQGVRRPAAERGQVNLRFDADAEWRRR